MLIILDSDHFQSLFLNSLHRELSFSLGKLEFDDARETEFVQVYIKSPGRRAF